MNADGGACLTFNYDKMVDVPHTKSGLALDRLSPTMQPTRTGIFPSPYVYPKNMKLRESKRGLQKQVPESWGSDHYEANVAGRQEEACGESIQHFKAKNYSRDSGMRCKRKLEKQDTVPGNETLKQQSLFKYSSSIQVPISEPNSILKPKNMRHPGLVLPPGLTTTQCLFAFNPQKTGTPARLQQVSGRVSPEVPRYVTHDFTSMSPAVQANYRKTQSMLFPRSESSKGDYQTEYGRRYVSQREPPRTSADVMRRDMPPAIQPSSSVQLAQPLLAMGDNYS